MTRTWKYEVMCFPSGWVVYDNERNEKVATFTGRKSGRFDALRYLYHLNGWDWSRSKYVRENPYLANIEISYAVKMN